MEIHGQVEASSAPLPRPADGPPPPLPTARTREFNSIPLELKVYRDLKVCPFCAKDLEIHPFSGNKACFVHGDFVVKILNKKVTVEFQLMHPNT